MLARNLELRLDPAAIMRRAGMPPDAWQVRLLRSRAERTLLLCSRQSGKSTVTAAMALHEVVFHPKSLVLLLSPSLRQSQELFRKVPDFRNRLGEPIAIAEESALRVELRNGSRIVTLPGTEGTVRGFSGVRLIIVDEAARVDDQEWWYQQEYECSFSDTTDQFFRTIDVEKAFSDDVTPLFPDAPPLQPLSLPSGDVFLDDIDPITDSEQ